jgi:hypothetical protein
MILRPDNNVSRALQAALTWTLIILAAVLMMLAVGIVHLIIAGLLSSL